jgi:hypothetical protein
VQLEYERGACEDVALSQASDGDSDEQACDLISMAGTVAKDFPFPFLLSECERRAAGRFRLLVEDPENRNSQLASADPETHDARCYLPVPSACLVGLGPVKREYVTAACWVGRMCHVHMGRR